MESPYDIPSSNMSAAAHPGDFKKRHLSVTNNIIIVFSKRAGDTENIYDVPSALLRKISDRTLGNLLVFL